MRRKKRGQYFEIDAIVAIVILIIGFIYIKSLQTTQPNLEQNRQYSKSCVDLLRDQKIGTLDSPIKEYILASNLTNYTNDNNSVSQQIAVYYIMGNQTLAANLTNLVIGDLIPDTSGYEVILKDPDSHTIYRRQGPLSYRQLSVGRTLVTGVKEIAITPQTQFLWGPSIIECHVWQ